ncbi:MAG: hypothetical protein R3C10_09890 [Pirellulales bacterium]
MANAHRQVEPEIAAIYRIVLDDPSKENAPNEPVKLLEVNPNSSASGIIPVGLPAHAPSGIFFPSTIVEIHPSEFDAVRNGTTRLPDGWRCQFDHQL